MKNMMFTHRFNFYHRNIRRWPCKSLTLLVCLAFCPAKAEVVKDPKPDNLQLVEDYANALLKQGEDSYGPQPSPLIVTCMDLKTFNHLQRDDSRFQVLTEAEYRPRDLLYRAANPQQDENLYQILYSLSQITGDRRYAQDANEVLSKYFQLSQNSRTGLFAWGEHMGWDFDNNQVQNPLWLRGGKWAQRFNGKPIHEFYRPWVLWPQSFQLEKARCLKFAKGLWDYQIYNHTGDFSRHAGWDAPNPDPHTGWHFPRHGGFYIATWAYAYHVSGDATFLKAIQTQLDFYDSIRDPKLHFLPATGSGKHHSLEKDYEPQSDLSLAIDLDENSHFVTKDLAVRMQDFARRELELYLELTTNRPPAADWQSGYGDVSEAGNGVMLFVAARSCPDTEISKRLAARGLGYAQAYLEGNPDTAKWLVPGDLGQAILLLIEAYKHTGDNVYLDKAHFYARYAVNIFLDGTALPRALKGANFYHAITRGDTLMMALLKLWQIDNRPDLVLNLQYTDR